MRDWSNIFNHIYFQTSSLQGTYSRFPARPGALNRNFDFFHSVLHSLTGSLLGSHLGGERCAFSRAFKPDSAGTSPRNGITFRIGDGNDGIIKGGFNMCHTLLDIFTFPPSGSGNSSSQLMFPPYLAFLRTPTVRLGPLRVLALFLVF